MDMVDNGWNLEDTPHSWLRSYYDLIDGNLQEILHNKICDTHFYRFFVPNAK